MKKIKILHSADLHFDTPFRDVDEMQSKLNKEELKEVFKNIIKICRDEEVDIFLLAGDIFDNFTISKETIYFMEKTFEEIKNTKVFISPGNHDPYGNKSFYKLIKWPENVYIFKNNIEKIFIKDLDVNVWGGAFTKNHINKSLLSGVKAEEDKINIMVLHGEIANSAEENEYNPITIREIGLSNMDYIALGHRHKFSGIMREENTYYAYSGCPQGRGFDELGDKGIIIGYVSKGAVELQFKKTCLRKYQEITVDISDCYIYEEVKEKILNAISDKENFYKIVLKGEISREFQINEDLIHDKLKNDLYYCKIKDKTILKINYEELSRGYSVKGIFTKNIIEEIEKEENETEKDILMLALKLGISSLSEGEVRMDDY